jgi:hypothetical protein
VAQLSVGDDAVNQSKVVGTIASGTLSEPLNGWYSTSYPADAGIILRYNYTATAIDWQNLVRFTVRNE